MRLMTATSSVIRLVPKPERVGLQRQQTALSLDDGWQRGSASAPDQAFAVDGIQDEQDRARRFRDAALPHLDDVYTFARFLLRNSVDAEDAVQECYLRALRHFDSFRGPTIKPWLFAILRNVCRTEFARRSTAPQASEWETDAVEDAVPIWQEPQASPEAELLCRLDGETIRRLVSQLPAPFREVIVLREINDLSYRQISDVAGIPVGTVMSRLARARSMLRKAWLAEGEKRA
jgi:RNA polymerase sigma-70 factor (ECF subfamily)